MRCQFNRGWGKLAPTVYLRGPGQDLIARPEGPSLRMGWMNGVSKVSFNVLHTFWVNKTCVYILIYIYVYIFKNCRQHSNGFQNFMSSWGWVAPFSKLPYLSEFSNMRFKSCLLSFLFLFEFIFFFENLKNFLPTQN